MCEVSGVAIIDSTVGFQTNWQTNTKRNQPKIAFLNPTFQKA